MHAEQVVYLDYTQAELDRMYDQRAWAPNAERIISRWKLDGETARSTMLHWRNVRYGPSPGETLDVFRPRISNAPVHVHVHGGRWALFGKEDVSFIAPAFVDQGAAFVAVNFDKIGTVSMSGMVEQIRRALCWIQSNAASFGGDSAQVHVSAHSSGAHLVASALTTAPASGAGLARNAIKSALLISGIYDLRPVMLSARARYVSLAREEVSTFSPILNVAALDVPMSVAWAENDNPEFKRQSLRFYNELRAHGKALDQSEQAGANHFEIVTCLAQPETALHAQAQALMNGTRLSVGPYRQYIATALIG